MELPDWVRPWCRDHLGSEPVRVLHGSRQMSEVFGLRLADGREIALKARPSQNGREAACLQVQRSLAAQGFPCAAPLTEVSVREGTAIHAEQWRPGGETLKGDDPATAARFARLLARQVELAAGLEVRPPLPNPEWTRWDHRDPGPWPELWYNTERLKIRKVPASLDAAATRLRERLAGVRLPRVLGHADWESQNLRWHGDRPWTVHDWDSIAWLPEAAIAGAASGAFASHGAPTLTPIASSAAFLEAYQAARRPFSAEEIEVAWAASLWLGLHNARGEVLWDHPPFALRAVDDQAGERLRRAGA